ncbi:MULTISPECIES: ABC transporter ATP-binding protein [Alphaproteobacteria]|uniref:ABC transporter ATP-binding protein n=1 Tax=Alphaproteobacteria TaxID=28211 RepID=UPI003A8D6C87
MAALLEIKNLVTEFVTDSKSQTVLRAIDDLSLTVERGEVLGLVGESGSGKSVTGFSILNMVDAPGRITSGNVIFDGQDIVGLDHNQMRQIRGRRIAMVFQDPMMTLNPVLRVGTQIIEAIQAHDKMPPQQARAMARDALGLVGIPSPEERLDAYPHEFSGGMRQRVAIAIALLHRPDLIIADEPTTALDVTIQAQILSQFQTLIDKYQMGVIWITHDLAVVSKIADNIAVMYGGKIVESGPSEHVLFHARHPYTQGLINSIPNRAHKGVRLEQIPGVAPSLADMPQGCAFHPRCAYAADICRTPPVSRHDGRGTYACHFPLGQDVTQ